MSITLGSLRVAVAVLVGMIAQAGFASIPAQAETASWLRRLANNSNLPETQFAAACGPALATVTFADAERVRSLLLDYDFHIRIFSIPYRPFDPMGEKAARCCETALLSGRERFDGEFAAVYAGHVHRYCAKLTSTTSFPERFSAHLMGAKRNFLSLADTENPRVAQAVAMFLNDVLWRAKDGERETILSTDYQATAEWLQAQAETGNWIALLGLSLAFEKGLGVPKDQVKAQSFANRYLSYLQEKVDD